MGRNSGWLAASTALARDEAGDPPHLIYMPERVFNKDRFLSDVERVYRQVGYVVIVVCEGLKDEKGQAIIESKVKTDIDSFGHAQSGGIADFLCGLIRDELKLKARFDKPGTIQRVSIVCASDVDIEEAYMVGRAAVQMSLEGKSGCMVTLKRMPAKEYKSITGSIAFEQVANKEKLMPDRFIGSEANDVTEQFIKWAKPLIEPGLPKYARLKKAMVQKRLDAFRI
jgi:6-phosphofructokinase 1